jgi:RNA polymerase sigma-70 factor, ECF subfamily
LIKDNKNTNEESILINLIEKYGQQVHRVIYSYTKDKHTTEDLAQEVFISVYQHLASFKMEAAISTWVTRIAINKAKDHLKSAWVRRTSYNVAQSFFKKEKSAESEALTTIHNEELLNLILLLPLKYREVFILFHIEEFKISEISKVLEINENTVRTRLRRAKEKLSNLFIKEGIDQ